MNKVLTATLALVLMIGLSDYTAAQPAPQNPCGVGQMMGRGQMGSREQADHHGQTRQGKGMMGPMGRGMHGHMGSGMPMMEMMGSGMGMAGGMMKSPEIMGTMMSIHGEVVSLMGRIVQKYGAKMGQMTPELQQKIRKETMEAMGEILSKHGAALKEKAKTGGK